MRFTMGKWSWESDFQSIDQRKEAAAKKGRIGGSHGGFHQGTGSKKWAVPLVPSGTARSLLMGRWKGNQGKNGGGWCSKKKDWCSPEKHAFSGGGFPYDHSSLLMSLDRPTARKNLKCFKNKKKSAV